MCKSGDVLFAGLIDGQGEISFIATNRIAPGVEIILTRQHLELTPFGTAEFTIGRGGYLLWTAPDEGVEAGAVVTLSRPRIGDPDAVEADLGTVVRGGNFQFSGIGDGLFAVTGKIIDGQVRTDAVVSYVVPGGSYQTETSSDSSALVLPASTKFFAYDVFNCPDMFETRSDMVSALLNPDNFLTEGPKKAPRQIAAE